MARRSPPRLKNLPAAKQRRMDELLDRNSQGTITIAEKSRLETLVAEAEQLMVENGRRLAEFASRDVASVPVDAVPVTVWVKPAQVEDRQ
jgi:hypothetical protein